jgi:hypothetical protein
MMKVLAFAVALCEGSHNEAVVYVSKTQSARCVVALRGLQITQLCR